MANFPMIPMTWNIANTTTILCNDSLLSIHRDGTMVLNGSAKNAALGLIKYVIQNEYVSGITSWQLNDAIRIEYDGNFTLHCIAEIKPDFFDELVIEFNRLVKIKAFW